MKTVASRLKAARLHKKWTQAQLAVCAGVSTGTVGNVEAGIRQAPGSLPLLAQAMGISHAWLAYGQGDMIATSTPEAPEGKPLTAVAVDLARLFDMLPETERVRRAQAYSAAAAAILAVVESPENAPQDPRRKTLRS